ncbi:MAG: hypothetical protein P8Q94_00300, partial [Candidatus Poseidoniaceae archaeon]|nr:hypothetical protein [Candidatus Poseidoniaceae archaeon]
YSTYFLSVDEFGTSGSIITAIMTSSLLSEDVSFPVTIDPTFTYVATGQNTYPVCDISANNCHFKTDGRYEYDNWGDMEDSPRFPFQFGSTLPGGNALSPVESISARVTYNADGDDGFADIIVLEDCGISSAGAPDGSTVQLGAFANPGGCTGNALPAYTPPTATGNPVYTYSQPTASGRMSCSSYWNECLHWSHFGVDNSHNYGHGNYVSVSDGSSSNGIFPGGTYTWEVLDSFGDGMNNNAYYGIYKRAAGGAVTNTQYGWSNVAQMSTTGFSTTGAFTIPSSEEFVIRYYCPSSSLSGCWTGENQMTIQESSGIILPQLSSGGDSLNRGPDATLALGIGEEARMTWNCGSWCTENIILWRTAGQSWSWANSWAPNGGGAFDGVTYYSNTEGTLIQNAGGTTMNIEFLVYDSNGDGTNGGSGSVEAASLGTWGTVPATPWGLRQVSMVSSESLGYISIPQIGQGTRTINLCSTAVECSDQTSSISMLSDAIANGGYIEMGLGFANSAVSQSPDQTIGSAGPGGAEFYIDKFELIIDFEEAVDDTTPPEDKTEVHYQGNTYIEGPRTLMLEIEDTEHAIDTTTANGPKLWYSIDNSNYISTPATLVSSICNAKEQTCAFTAQTSHLSHGSVVDYYWTYQDASGPTATKPNQGANPAQSATVQFTLVDPLNAGTAQKMTTLVENVKANFDGGVKTTGNTIDRQMTYFVDTNEYLFEFDTSECETYTSAGYSCFSTDSDNEYGHWDVIWQDVVNACSPGSSGCTGTSDNSLTLEASEGGQFDVSRQFGLGYNLALKYDSTVGSWVAVGIGDGSNGLRIQDRLDPNAPDTVTES